MAIDPSTINDAKLVRNLMENAKRAGMSDLVLRCQIRIAELNGQAFDDEIEREFWTAVTVAEEIATLKNRRTTRLSRTRQKQKRVGAIQCLIDWALDQNVTQGFQILVENGYPKLTGEAIVIRHAAKFPTAAVESAKYKLAKHGVDVETIR